MRNHNPYRQTLLPHYCSGIFLKSNMHEVLSYGYIENGKMHPHRNMGMEIVLVDRGHLEWAVDEKPEHLNSGDIFFTLPWQTHGSTTIGEPKNKIYFVLFKLKSNYTEQTDNILFPDALGFSLEEQQFLSQTFCKATRHTWNASPILQQLFPELINCLNSKDKLDALSSINQLRSIVVELAKTIDKGLAYKTQENLSTEKVRSFLSSLTRNLTQPWTLNQMAGTCGIKRTQFSKISQRLCGYPPLTYLGLLRFSKACHLLLNTKKSLTDIAFDCGYNSSQYFSDTFKKLAKMTPSLYRRAAPEIKEIFASNWKNPEWRSIEEEQLRMKGSRCE